MIYSDYTLVSMMLEVVIVEQVIGGVEHVTSNQSLQTPIIDLEIKDNTYGRGNVREEFWDNRELTICKALASSVDKSVENRAQSKSEEQWTANNRNAARNITRVSLSLAIFLIISSFH